MSRLCPFCYAGWLKEYAQKYRVAIHAWVMMTNHVHLLCTPRQEGGISRMMQSLGRRYVQYFNFEYRRRVLIAGSKFAERQRNYRKLLSYHVDGELLDDIRSNTQKGMAVGNDRFKAELSALTGRRLKAKKRGRSVGWRKAGA
ncbi:MAG: transposase [Thermodesulfobacteriota bacterium]